MAEMVASALVQEGVSGALSLVVSNREEKASQGHLLERLEMAQSQLEFALERSRKMPITDVSLLRRRMVIKRAFMECTVVLLKHKQPGDEEAEQTTVRRKIMHALLRPVWYFSSRKKDLLTRSDVSRFEWFAEMAVKFVRDVESGCSLLACYRFSNPIVTQLLEGKYLAYISLKGKKSFYHLSIGASRTEDHGVMAALWFRYSDPESPMNEFGVSLYLRLSESTDIVGIGTKCMQSLGPNFKCLPEVPTGLLAYLSTHVQGSNDELLRTLDEVRCATIGYFRPDPVCCTSELNKSCSSNTISSELSGRFPEQVTSVRFLCNVSPGADYNLRSSTRQVKGKSMKAWQYLELNADFYPHDVLWGGIQASTIHLHHIEEAIHTEAINFFSCQPKQRKYGVMWRSAHGRAYFTVSKPTVNMRCAPSTIGDGSMTQRVSKRKR